MHEYFLVPVIAVFTKYDQFKRNVKMDLERSGHRDQEMVIRRADEIFQQYYLGPLQRSQGSDSVQLEIERDIKFVRLESELDLLAALYSHIISIGMQKPDQRCTGLIEATSSALSEAVVALMLVAVQKTNLELSIRRAVER